MRRSRGWCRGVALVLCAISLVAVGLVGAATPAAAATWVITSTADGGPGSLRQAFADASVATGAQTIELAASQTYELTVCTGDSAALFYYGTSDLTINGHDSTIRQTCPSASLAGVIYKIGPGALTVNSVTITGGAAQQPGGGIASAGDMTLKNVTVTGNASSLGTAGVAAGAHLTMIDSLVTGNTSTGDGAGAGGVSGFDVDLVRTLITDNTSTQVGGVFAAHVTLDHSTVAANHGENGPGGVFATSLGLSTIRNSTISDNTSTNSVGALWVVDVDLQFATISNNASPQPSLLAQSIVSHASIVAGSAPACQAPTLASSGYNYEVGGNTCGFTTETDVHDGADPQLLRLANYGGPTLSQLFATSSPLKDKVPAGGGCADDDQRGFPRPQNGACDIGAVEMRVPSVAAIQSSTQGTKPISIDVNPSVTDPDGWFIDGTLRAPGRSPHGAVALTSAANTLTYTADASFAGSDSFLYTMCDQQDALCLSAPITIEVASTPTSSPRSTPTSSPAQPVLAEPPFTG